MQLIYLYTGSLLLGLVFLVVVVPEKKFSLLPVVSNQTAVKLLFLDTRILELGRYFFETISVFKHFT